MPEQCVHHWLIKPAEGPISEGTCKKCGELREFKNSPEGEGEDLSWRVKSRKQARALT